MKIIMRFFFKGVRIVVGPFLLLWERVTTPKGIVRSVEAQSRLDALTRDMILYQYKTCPFCMKVRKAIAGRSLTIEKRDAQHDLNSRRELEQLGGQIKVPCLRITTADGSQRWLYESDAIIRFLEDMPDSIPPGAPSQAG